MSPKRRTNNPDDEFPTDPGSLDDMATGFFGAGDSMGDDAETQIPGRGPGGNFSDDDAPTLLGHGPGGFDETLIDAAPKKAVDAILWVKEGSRRGKWYPIRKGTVIGRDEGSVILDDPRVSSTHAKFTLEKGQYVIWDFGSANGTYVNGKRIREATPLDENDRIKIGNTVFLVKLLDARKKPVKKKTTAAKSTTRKTGAAKK